MNGSIWPERHADDSGRASKKAAAAALAAHVAVLKGEPLKRAISDALADAKGLGGQERRFVAFAARELPRHRRLLDLAARECGFSPGKWKLVQDQALVRYVLWRRLFTGATWERMAVEVKLPGPLRPRSVSDAVLQTCATASLPEPEVTAAERVATRHSFPSWLSERIAASLPAEELEPALAALNREPDLILRARRPGLVEVLRDAGVACEPIPNAPAAVRVLDPGQKVFDTAPMKAGQLQVQDLGSQWIAELCGLSSPGTIIDACAGAGGKTAALADQLGTGGEVIAADTSSRRLADARGRMKGFGLRNVRFEETPEYERADLVLVDAPCSGTGTLAKEPTAKWTLNEAKVRAFAKRQRELLESIAGRLRPGGRLVYATCSILREEDEDVVASLLASHPEFALEPAGDFIAEPKAVSGPHLRVWPHRLPGGGYFGARMRKKNG